MTLRPSALGCTSIAAVMRFTGTGKKRREKRESKTSLADCEPPPSALYGRRGGGLVILPIDSGALADIPGRTHGEDTFIAAGEYHPLQKPAPLIVQEVFIPFIFHEFRYDDHNAAIRMFLRQIENELNDRNDDKAIG